MRWYEYKMEVDDLTAPDDLKAKLLAMTDTLTAEEKAEPMMAAPAPQTAAPLNTETKKKKPIHFPVKQLGTLAACLAVCVLVPILQHPASGHRNGQRQKQRARPVRSRRRCRQLRCFCGSGRV